MLNFVSEWHIDWTRCTPKSSGFFLCFITVFGQYCLLKVLCSWWGSYFSRNCPTFFLKRWTMRLSRRAFWREAVTQGQSQMKKERQCQQLAHQVIAVPWSPCVTSQVCLFASSCTSCQQPSLEVLLQREVKLCLPWDDKLRTNLRKKKEKQKNPLQYCWQENYSAAWTAGPCSRSPSFGLVPRRKLNGLRYLKSSYHNTSFMQEATSSTQLCCAVHVTCSYKQ